MAPILAGSESRLGTLGGPFFQSHNLGVAFAPIIKITHLIWVARQTWTAVLSLTFFDMWRPTLAGSDFGLGTLLFNSPSQQLSHIKVRFSTLFSIFVLTLVQGAAANGTKPNQLSHTRASSHSPLERDLW